MKLTLILPAVGKEPGKKYLRAWQMEPLQIAQMAAITPDDVEINFWDDRMEDIPYDEPTDLVAISVETYTAKRAYQIASEYRSRNITVIMGGFHATLCPDEVAEYAECVVTGEAENIWKDVINDFKEGRLKKLYNGSICKMNTPLVPDRSVYNGKDYVDITLLEAGRGCRFNCEFCSIHEFFKGNHNYRPIDVIVDEIKTLKDKTKLFFFVDDNIISDQNQAIELFKALIPLKIKWVGQADILVSKNAELLDVMVQSGCQGVLIGFESLSPYNLKKMQKSMISSKEKMTVAINTIHKKGLRIYATFLFGYDEDTEEDFDTVLNFCVDNKLFMVGFNHLTPFPGTQLYERLKKEERLTYDKWWLSDKYTYGVVPFKSKLDSEKIENECRRIRRKFYGFNSLLYRLSNITNINSLLMFGMYVSINTLLRKDTSQRELFPMGDQSFKGPLIKAKQIVHKQ